MFKMGSLISLHIFSLMALLIVAIQYMGNSNQSYFATSSMASDSSSYFLPCPTLENSTGGKTDKNKAEYRL